MFGDKSGTVVKEKKELLLLLRTLSALVPHDPVFVLKVQHILYDTFWPLKGQDEMCVCRHTPLTLLATWASA